MPVDVQYAADVPELPDADAIRSWVHAALPHERRDADITVRIVAADEGLALNRQYRGGDHATNVLSFPADLPPGVGVAELGVDLLGDIVVCAPVATAEAAAQCKSLTAHVAHLVVHGTLHLLGHDHVVDADAERMEARERTVLAALGFADPYAASGAAAPGTLPDPDAGGGAARAADIDAGRTAAR